MPTIWDRIRRARKLARLSQQELAAAVGVKRSAVAQWERHEGSHPSMDHMIAVAVVTGVHVEWLGTGRGPVRGSEDGWTPAVRTDEYAQDDIEATCLQALRKLPLQMRKQLVNMVALVAQNF